MVFRNYFFDLKSDVPKINIEAIISWDIQNKILILRLGQVRLGILKLKIENRLSRKSRYLVKEFIHVQNI